jgi:type II secretory pathway component PulM
MLAKLTDAAGMFWQSLDQRERTLVMYGAAFLLAQVAVAVTARERERREQALLGRVEEMIRGAH